MQKSLWEKQMIDIETDLRTMLIDAQKRQKMINDISS